VDPSQDVLHACPYAELGGAGSDRNEVITQVQSDLWHKAVKSLFLKTGI